MNAKSSDTPSALFSIQRTSTWMVENFKRVLKWLHNSVTLHSRQVQCKTMSKTKLQTSDKQSTRIVPQQVKTQFPSHWKEMSQNWMMWKVNPRFACKQPVGQKKNVIGEHWSNVAYYTYACNNCTIRIIYHSFILLTFLWNRCYIKMHNVYQFSGKYVLFVVPPDCTSPEKKN